MSLNHNKRRNVGLVYECLTREIAEATVAGDRKRAATALEIIGRHFADGTFLADELSVHRQAASQRGVSRDLARRIVDSIKAAGIRLSSRESLRGRAKDSLIKDCFSRLGKDLLDRHRIPDYKAHASVGIILARGIGRLDESVDAAKVEEYLIEHLISRPGETPSYDPDRTAVAYKTALRIFQEELGSQLDDQQSELIGEHVRASLGGDPRPMKRAMLRHRDRLIASFTTARTDSDMRADESMLGRLDEAIDELKGMDGSFDESTVERMMMFHQVRREIES